MNDDQLVLQRLEMLVKSNPEFLDDAIFTLMGEIYCRLRRYGEAADAYKKAVRIKPFSADAQYGLGFVSSLLGRREEAIAAFKEAVRLAPYNSVARFSLGREYGMARRYEDAIAELKEAVRLNPADLKAYCLLGLSFLNLSRFVEANEACNAALARNPNNPECLYLSGLISSKMNLLNDAAGYMKRAIIARPDYESAYTELIRIYYLQNKIGELGELKNVLRSVFPHLAEWIDELLNRGAETGMDLSEDLYDLFGG